MNQSLGNILREARAAKNLNQEEVAGLIGKTQKAYSNYESGRKISLDDLNKLINELDIPIEKIIKSMFPKVERVVLKADSNEAPGLILSKSELELIRVNLSAIVPIFLSELDSKTYMSQKKVKFSGKRKPRPLK